MEQNRTDQRSIFIVHLNNGTTVPVVDAIENHYDGIQAVLRVEDKKGKVYSFPIENVSFTEETELNENKMRMELLVRNNNISRN